MSEYTNKKRKDTQEKREEQIKELLSKEYLTLREIAEKLNVSEKTAKVTTTRMKRQGILFFSGYSLTYGLDEGV